MVREAMRLRRSDRQGAGLRPADAAPVTQWDSALRSDYVYTDAPLGVEETFLNADNIGYSSADLRFDPAAVVAKNPYATYGSPTAYDIVRSPAGVPVTNQDGYLVARYDFAATIIIASLATTSNVVTVTTATAHGFTVGQTVNIRVGGAQAAYSGAYVITTTPLSTTFTYALTTANLGTTAQTNASAFVVGVGGSPLMPGQTVRAVDTGLISGQFYYYGLFARYFFQGNTYWLRVANSELLVPVDYGSAQWLWESIPEYYRRLDTEQVGASATPGVLQRFVWTWGYALDQQRTWNSTVGDLWDAARINARLLRQLGDALGHGSNEAVLGDKRYRNILANLMYLRKLRGTKDGIEGWLQAATGYKILAYMGKNIMLTNDDTEFRTGNGSWTVAAGTLARITSAGEAGGPSSGQFYLRLTNGTGGTIVGTFTASNTIPVTAGHQYRLSFYVKSSVAARTANFQIVWLDGTGATLSTFTDTAQSTTTSWTQLSSAWATAPANAVFARIQMLGPGLLTTEVISFWRVMFTDRSWLPTGQVALYGDPPTTWEAARVIHVSLYPQRTNYAINSDFSRNPGTFPEQGWVATDPATYDTLPFAYSSYDAIYNRTVSNKALTANVATLTTTTAHGLIVGNVVTVSGVDATFNGTYTVTAVPTTTTFSYAKVNANVTSVASGGNVAPAPENSYDDLLAGYDSLSNSTTLTFTPTGMTTPTAVPGYMTVATSVAPYSSRASSAFFPVVQSTPFSARVVALASIANTQARLRIRWYTASNPGAEIVGTDMVGQYITLPVWTSGSMVGGAPVVVGNATPPANALWARVVVEGQGVATNNVYVTYSIFEDAAVPGPWFDGNSTESAFGDYRFTGVAGQSFSAYYMQYNAVMNGLANADRVHAILPELIPQGMDYTFHTVQNSLL